jgi:hypothetical protein
MRMPYYQITFRAVVATAMLGSRLAAGTSIAHTHACDDHRTHAQARLADASGRSGIGAHSHSHSHNRPHRHLPAEAFPDERSRCVETIDESHSHVHFSFLGFDLTTPVAPGSTERGPAGATLRVAPMIASPTVRVRAAPVQCLPGWLVGATPHGTDSPWDLPENLIGSMANAAFLVDSARYARSMVLLM